jgi:MSHA biogenesis protein MshP
MLRKRRVHTVGRRSARGFSAMSAIAILVVLAILGAYIASVSTFQHQSSALDILGARAVQAAKAGIEWGAYRILNPEDSASAPYDCGNAGTGAGSVDIAGLGQDLAEFTVTVTCSIKRYSDAPQFYTEFGNTIRIYELTATACNIPAGTACPNNSSSPGYVERQITTIIATCRDATAQPCS